MATFVARSAIEQYMTNDNLTIFAAPLQGYTDAAWRNIHSRTESVDTYFTPFLRVEKGKMRYQDVKALNSPLNKNVKLIPQIIFRDTEEFLILVNSVKDAGFSQIDLNLGCPFPPQVRHGRGAALLRRPDLLREIAEVMRNEFPDIRFSAKMRLGIDDGNEWEKISDAINLLPLSFLTVHPRIAAQQYGGELLMEQFNRIYATSSHPIVYNGDILTTEDAKVIIERYPDIHAIMIGRGLIGNPSLADEIRQEISGGVKSDDSVRRRKMLDIHSQLYQYYRDTLCGDTQILSKIKPFWDYAEPLFGRKSLKAIKKATSTQKYEAAVSSLQA